MIVVMVLQPGPLGAQRAFEWLLARVNCDVPPNVADVWRLVPAHAAERQLLRRIRRRSPPNERRLQQRDRLLKEKSAFDPEPTNVLCATNAQ
jgi:hypothetical protein